MEQKICIVTGANSGIGFELAKGMVDKGYRTVMVCRNKERGEQALKRIKEITQQDSALLMLAEHSSQESIRKFVVEFNERFSKLDVLFNNAGANFFDFQLTEDDIELTFAVNYLAPFLMTQLLLPKLSASPSAKIITTVGSLSKKAKIQFKEVQSIQNYNVIQSANWATLAKYLFTYALSKRLLDSNVTANCFHPGAARTSLQRKMPLTWRLLFGCMRPFFKPTAKGAETGLFVANSKEAAGTNGKIFKNKKESPLPLDESMISLAGPLWKHSVELTNLVSFGIQMCGVLRSARSCPTRL